MNKSIFCILIAVFIISFGAINANALEPGDTVLRFLQSLKNGNIEMIKDSITGEFLSKRKVLLEQNENYSEFLKKVYQEAEFRINETTAIDNDVLVNVEVNSPNGKTELNLFLKKDMEGNWKIFKEIYY